VSASILPCLTRILQLKSLEMPRADLASEPSRDPADTSANQNGLKEPQNGTGLKPGFLVGGNVSMPVKKAFVPEPHLDTTEAGDARCPASVGGHTSKKVLPCIQFIHLHSLRLAMEVIGEAAALIMGTMQLMKHTCLQQAWAVLDDLSGGLVTSWQPPWSAEFIEEITLDHLSRYPESTLLGWAMNVDAFVSFLARFAAAAMRGGWVPGVGYPTLGGPKVEELNGNVKSDTLCATCPDEKDGTLGTAAASSSEASEVAHEPFRPRMTPSQPSFASPELSQAAVVQVDTDDDDDDDGWEAEATPAACASSALQPAVADEDAAEPERQQVSPIVAVLPDVATQWHLEVLGALVSSLGVYMISERAWRADFAAESNVPFSMEALPSQEQRFEGNTAPCDEPSESPLAQEGTPALACNISPHHDSM